jgi:sugar phosphate isomerase/epimerase
MYSLSTCWNSHRHTDGRAMLREIRELGFDFAELSHGIRISLLPGILDAVEAGEIRISTLHNFCPLPIGINHAAPNIFQFTADDARERESAYRHSVRTIEIAAKLKARLVVLHLGSIDMKDYTERLEKLAGENQREGKAYLKLQAEAEEVRQKKKAKSVQRMKEMLQRIAAVAKTHGVWLGTENREALEEIPIDADFPGLLEEFNDGTVWYWHDTGHAQIKENLGFLKHTEHLATVAPRLAGFHVHDVHYPARDHCVPGTGTVDFVALKPFVKPDHIKVFEMHPAIAAPAVRQGVAHVKAIWGDE